MSHANTVLDLIFNLFSAYSTDPIPEKTVASLISLFGFLNSDSTQILFIISIVHLFSQIYEDYNENESNNLLINSLIDNSLNKLTTYHHN